MERNARPTALMNKITRRTRSQLTEKTNLSVPVFHRSRFVGISKRTIVPCGTRGSEGNLNPIGEERKKKRENTGFRWLGRGAEEGFHLCKTGKPGLFAPKKKERGVSDEKGIS